MGGEPAGSCKARASQLQGSIPAAGRLWQPPGPVRCHGAGQLSLSLSLSIRSNQKRALCQSYRIWLPRKGFAGPSEQKNRWVGVPAASQRAGRLLGGCASGQTTTSVSGQVLRGAAPSSRALNKNSSSSGGRIRITEKWIWPSACRLTGQTATCSSAQGASTIRSPPSRRPPPSGTSSCRRLEIESALAPQLYHPNQSGLALGHQPDERLRPTTTTSPDPPPTLNPPLDGGRHATGRHLLIPLPARLARWQRQTILRRPQSRAISRTDALAGSCSRPASQPARPALSFPPLPLPCPLDCLNPLGGRPEICSPQSAADQSPPGT